MAKPRKGKKRARKKEEGIPMITFVTMLGGGIVGYLAGEIVFFPRPHPVHWSVALGVTLLGYLIGTLIYRLRGDIL